MSLLKYFNPNIVNIKAYQPGRSADEVKSTYQLEAVTKLCSNESPFPPSHKVLEAIGQASSQIGRYPYDPAPHLKQLLAEQDDLTVEQITLGAGSSELFDILLRGLCQPKESVIVSQYSFALYRTLCQAHDLNVIEIKENQFLHDLDATLEAITPTTKVIFVTNPNNPTGSWIEKQALFDFIEAVPEHVFVVVDEAYHDFMHQQAYSSAAQLIDKHHRLIVVRTFSKAYGLAGLRLGYAMAHPETTALFNQARKPFNVSNIAIKAGVAAIQDRQHLQMVLDNNRCELERVALFFEQQGFRYIATSGNFLTVEFGESAFDLSQELLQQGIIVRPLIPYNMKHHLRISIGLPEENSQLMQIIQPIIRGV